MICSGHRRLGSNIFSRLTASDFAAKLAAQFKRNLLKLFDITPLEIIVLWSDPQLRKLGFYYTTDYEN